MGILVRSHVSDKWYYAHDDQQVGPLTLQELKKALAAFSNAEDVLIWCRGFADWKQVKDVPELNSPPPPPIKRAAPSSERWPTSGGRSFRRSRFPVGSLLGIILIVALVAIVVMNQQSSVGDNGARQQTREVPQVPALQLRFCGIIENAASSYRGLLQQSEIARKQQNGIVQQRLSAEMTSIYRARNVNIFQAVQQANFVFDGWLINVEKIRSPDGSNVSFDSHPSCSPITTIHATVAASAVNIELLSGKKQGDSLTVTGKFVERWGGKAGGIPGNPVSPEEFEGSFTEVGSITEPEYSAVGMLLK